AGSDALMAVLMGEPVREGDPAAESAARDMAVLGEQLKLIGDALATAPAEPGPEPDPDPESTAPTGPGAEPGARSRTVPAADEPAREQPPRQWWVREEVPDTVLPVAAPGGRRRRRPLLVLAASFAALASLVGAFALIQYYVAHPSSMSAAKDSARSADGATGSVRLSPGEMVACSSLIVEGAVARVERGPAAWLTVTLDIDTYLKPARGPARDQFRLPAEAENVTVGTRLLVIMGRADHDREPSHYYVGSDVASERDWVDQGLLEAATQELDCPGRG
ncbi:hypothetical protein ACWDR0_24775, partial [Streptomyces sp. NPDC003691]